MPAHLGARRAMNLGAGIISPDGALGPLAASFTAGAAAGSLVATVTGLGSGETISTIAPNDGRLALDAAKKVLIVGLTAASAGLISATLTTSSGRTLAMTVTVNVLTTVVRNIASGMRGPGHSSASTSNGTDTAQNSVMPWVNESGVAVNIADIQLMLPGFWTDSDANGPERLISGNLTVQACIEYPIGTTRQALPTAIVTASPYTLTDKSPTATGQIPANGVALIRVYLEAASGVKWPTSPAGQTSNTMRGGAETGAAGTLTNKVMSGSPAANQNAKGYFPMAVLAPVPAAKRSFASLGDSMDNAAGDGNYDANNNTGWNGRAASGRVPFMQIGVTGTTLGAQVGKMTNRLACLSAAGVTDVFVGYGSNDLASASTAWTTVRDNCITLLNQIKSALSGVNIRGRTLPTRVTSSTGVYQTIGDQVAGTGNFVPGSSSGKASYNAWVRSTPAPMVSYIELADAVEVNSSNVLTRDGGYMACNGAIPRVEAAYPSTVQASPAPTTTTFATNTVKAANYFTFGGRARFTSGALAGTTALISANDAAGGLTLTTALGSAPAANDNVSLQSVRMAATADGVHLNAPDINQELGGHFAGRDAAVPAYQAILAA